MLREEYRQKLKTPEEAVQIVRSGDWVDYGQVTSFPASLDRALAARKGELKDVKVRNSLSVQPVQIVEQDPEQESFTYNLWYCSGIDRKYLDQGKAYFIPMTYRDIGSYYTRGYAPVNVAMVSVSTPDEEGYFNLGLTNCCNREIIEAADYVILEVNDQMPHVPEFSGGRIHISEADALVEASYPPAEMGKAKEPSEIEHQIARNVMPFLHDGQTVQLGIGGIPNALGGMIADSDLKDLGMHTELMSDGYLRLYEAGRVTDRAKKINAGKGLFAICYGSKDLYDFVDENRRDICSASMSYTNDPRVIAEYDDFLSINGCISVDLFGQVSAETAGHRHISGAGGQLDYVEGAYLAEHGTSLITMPSSRVDRKGVRHSNIHAFYTGGDVITTPRNVAQNLVTEYGTACLIGKTTWERAEALIDIAHPDFRDELIREAESMGIWRRSNKK